MGIVHYTLSACRFIKLELADESVDIIKVLQNSII